jgi:hypothetical protein
MKREFPGDTMRRLPRKEVFELANPGQDKRGFELNALAKLDGAG